MRTANWLKLVGVEDLEVMMVFAEYARRLGSGTDGDVGEATVLAWAEVKGGIAILDDKAGRQAGKDRGVELHGTLWLVARGIKRSVVSAEEAATLVDELLAVGTHLPCSGAGFIDWARANGLIE